MSEMNVLVAEDLVLGFGGKALTGGISFEIGEGDNVAVVGPNGSGKTTLLKTLLGLVKPVSGSFRYDPCFRPGDIGYMPQVSPVQRDFPACVEEVVSSGVHTAPFAIFRRFKTPQIPQFAEISFPSLSIGQRQKVMWARATASRRRLLMLDEPAAGLDVETKREIYSAIKDINASGIPVVAVTHDIPDALEFATHVLELGAKPFFGKRDEWMERHEGYCTVCGDIVSGHHHHHGGGCRHGVV